MVPGVASHKYNLNTINYLCVLLAWFSESRVAYFMLPTSKKDALTFTYQNRTLQYSRRTEKGEERIIAKFHK